jgi:hypothetical protein
MPAASSSTRLKPVRHSEVSRNDPDSLTSLISLYLSEFTVRNSCGAGLVPARADASFGVENGVS